MVEATYINIIVWVEIQFKIMLQNQKKRKDYTVGIYE